jgi:riboflavin synthase
MFTGIIEELGTISSFTKINQGAKIEILAPSILSDAKIGDSIAVNGVCLTVVTKTNSSFVADLSDETLKLTSLKQLKLGSKVNLERPMQPQARFGGHLVQGHVDGIAKYKGANQVGEGYDVKIEFPFALGKYIVHKGSITVDGISLTVASLTENSFEIAIIPHTWKNTNLSSLSIGDEVNLEVDVIAKYVEKMLNPYLTPKPEISLDKLKSMGY